jgi:hypothetical protein
LLLSSSSGSMRALARLASKATLLGASSSGMVMMRAGGAHRHLGEHRQWCKAWAKAARPPPLLHAGDDAHSDLLLSYPDLGDGQFEAELRDYIAPADAPTKWHTKDYSFMRVKSMALY